eukprot:CAMPEP_0203967398 /NCGR_PEP_ID=MMETSP0359-20131031/96404_1 /ASSEMBLY_ACC=CAM_ASM_000338 /TAXON_ID=268821 /ORGANISM="Scrippsiella Hangoei, Strain SHTV-5" /LENGTH=60 /DNA_ID=CAMNT_0050905269 /DNA_START=11 /DNA_END=189 /DNA_ORIENTATION=+
MPSNSLLKRAVLNAPNAGACADRISTRRFGLCKAGPAKWAALAEAKRTDTPNAPKRGGRT